MSVCTITPRELDRSLAGQTKLRLVDVRIPAEFREVHVAGARNVPYYRLSAKQVAPESGKEEDDKIYVICKVGRQSQKACGKLEKLGLSNVINVEGGTDACIVAGLPVVRGKKAVSLERQVRIAAGALALVGGILAMAVNPYWAALPAFIGAGLVFSGVTDTCGMSTVMARMPWNQ